MSEVSEFSNSFKPEDIEIMKSAQEGIDHAANHLVNNIKNLNIPNSYSFNHLHRKKLRDARTNLIWKVIRESFLWITFVLLLIYLPFFMTSGEKSLIAIIASILTWYIIDKDKRITLLPISYMEKVLKAEDEKESNQANGRNQNDLFELLKEFWKIMVWFLPGFLLLALIPAQNLSYETEQKLLNNVMQFFVGYYLFGLGSIKLHQLINSYKYAKLIKSIPAESIRVIDNVYDELNKSNEAVRKLEDKGYDVTLK